MSRKYDAIVALGCVIRGETTHYDYVAGESARGILEASLRHQTPIGYGILAVENLEQAVERAGGRVGNKGREAAEAAVKMARLLKQLV
jgi:6,7-dimethyl-8-ribityllumazine synthase